MKQPTPPQSVNGIWFTEDDLAGAIFHNATITTTGQCTRQEARQAARMMLAAPDMLQALKDALEIFQTAKRYFPKAVTNADRFHLINIEANSVRKAIVKATEEAKA